MLNHRPAALIRIIGRTVRDRRHRRLVEPLFDRDFYRMTYPDVAKAGIEPLAHYLRHGWREGRQPSADFDTAWYLQHNPEVAASGQNPLVHYALRGRGGGRDAAVPSSAPDAAHGRTKPPFVNVSRSSDILTRLDAVRRASLEDSRE